MSVCKQTPRKNVQPVNRPSENTTSELQMKVRSCHVCQVNRKLPPEAPLHPWGWPHKPWARLHLDYAGPFLGKMFLIVDDAHSKWIEAFPMSTSTSEATIGN